MGLARSIFILLLVALLGACAGAAHRPLIPDDTPLRPAQALVKKAEDAGAGDLAPSVLREAYRRLDIARGVIYRAAVNNRKVNSTEEKRINRLVEEASVDARLALARTQQEAVQRKLNEYNASVRQDVDKDKEPQ